jgi:radical SAM superfamily enzyme YgiQ (UPF0313 family)
MSRAEMDALGWDSCDIIIVTGDAYVDHPSFGMAVIGRVLEATRAFAWASSRSPTGKAPTPFKALGKPNLFWGVTAGNMDSMINRYTADRKIRSDDAYTPGDVGGKRPDRAAIVYSQRCREAFKACPSCWAASKAACAASRITTTGQDKVRRSIVVDAKCDLLLYGNAERAIVEIAHRLAAREPVEQITDVRGTAFVRRASPEGWFEIDSTSVDAPGRVESHVNPYLTTSEQAQAQGETCARRTEVSRRGDAEAETAGPSVPLPSCPTPRSSSRSAAAARAQRDPPAQLRAGRADPVLYAHANRVLHLETNPGNARALVQAHGEGVTAARRVDQPAAHPADHGRDGPCVRPAVCAQPAPGLCRRERQPRRRDEDPRLGDDPLQREHHARLLRRLHLLQHHRARGPHHPEPQRGLGDPRGRGHPRQGAGFTGVISDLGGPTANMYRIGCKSRRSRPPAASPAACTPASART